MPLASSASSDWLAGPFFVAAGLLLVGGASKLRHPIPTARAFSSAGLPGSPLVVRAVGAMELIVGSACILQPSRPFSWGMAVTYTAFAGFLSYLIIARVPGASCGCLGRREIPPSGLHVLLNLVAAGAAALVAFQPLPGLLAFVEELPLYGIPFVIGEVALAYSAYLVVSLLPEVLRTLRPAQGDSDPAQRSGVQVLALHREAGG